jgi:uncharacterized protein YneF (UPF0154 family)
MWLEIKALLTVFGCVFILIGGIMAALSITTVMLIFMGIGMFMFGDVIIGYQITSKEVKPQIDPTPPRQELTIFQEIGGKVHFINTTKAEMGIRKFRWHGKEASVINDGVGMFTMPNGNRGFFSHENYDKSISMILCKALEDISHVTNTSNIKEIYDKAIQEIERVRTGRVHIEK